MIALYLCPKPVLIYTASVACQVLSGSSGFITYVVLILSTFEFRNTMGLPEFCAMEHPRCSIRILGICFVCILSAHTHAPVFHHMQITKKFKYKISKNFKMVILEH